MGTGKDRTVFKRSDGNWVNKKNENDKASSVHDTQKDAIQAANDMLKKSGGGELTVAGKDGKFRSKDTIPPGNDPNPPKDTEH